MFKDAMVRALLDGTKTQTRRLLGTFYEPGDRVYVKEAYRTIHVDGDPELRVIEIDYRATYTVGYRLGDNHGGPGKGVKWESSMFMPKRYARIWLEVTDARVERLFDISEEDAVAEGWPHAKTGGVGVPLRDAYPIGWYLNLWDDINGRGSAESNPEVRVITFRRIDA
jgi:hypothetical protein